MSNLQIFNFNSNPVRVELFDNQPHFCLLDVCEIFEIQNSRRVQSQMLDPQGVRLAYILAKDEKQRRTAFINEPNLYRIIFRSEKPIAKNFQNWVFEEVLPQIRKTGKYQVQPQQLALPEPEKKISFELTEKQWLRMASLWFALHNCLDVLDTVYKPLAALKSPYATTAYTHATEYQTSLGIAQRLLEPLFKGFDVDPIDEPHFHLALKTLRNYHPQGIGRLAKL